MKLKLKLKFNKNNMTITISIFLVCMVLFTILLIQFKTVQEVNETDIENMRETELREQLSTWKDKYETTSEQLTDVNNKISEYNSKIAANDASSELLDNELLQSNIIAGKTKVTGEGVVVTLTDTDDEKISANDLSELVNELRFAGAEAISINGIRVINTSDIVDIADRFILMKPRQRLTSPYEVKAIGDQTYLVSTLSLKNSGYIDTHTNSGQSVKVEKQKNIEIPPYSDDIEIKYMKEAAQQ